MKTIQYCNYLGQHPLTSSHPHYRSFTDFPPQGYQFQSTPTVNPNFNKVLDKVVNDLMSIGLSQEDIVQFITSRHVGSEHIPADAKLCFMLTLAQFITDRPWFVNIEDWTTLFTPCLNRSTHNLDIEVQPWFKAMKYIFEQPNCKAITTHVHSTIKSLQVLFSDSEVIKRKLRYLPMAYPGLKIDPLRQRKPVDSNNIVFLITNSYGGVPRNLELRGGIESLYAFKNVYESGKTNITLYVTGNVNLSGYPDLDEFCSRCNKVMFHPYFMEDKQLFWLLLNTDVFLIPSMRIHNCSLMSTMTFGLPAIFSDGWAFSEFVTDEVNGFIAKGQYGVTTYIDERGIFRDNYESCRINQKLISNIEEKMLKIISDPGILNKIGANARSYALENFDVYKRRDKFKELLDEIYYD